MYVTQAVVSTLKEQYNAALQLLVQSAGIDSTEDNRLRGYLQGLNEIFNIELDTIEEITENDDDLY